MFSVREAASKPENHFPIFQVANDESYQPSRDFHGNEDPYDDVMVAFIKCFAPVGQEVNNCSRFVRIISLFQNKVNQNDERM